MLLSETAREPFVFRCCQLFGLDRSWRRLSPISLRRQGCS